MSEHLSINTQVLHSSCQSIKQPENCLLQMPLTLLFLYVTTFSYTNTITCPGVTLLSTIELNVIVGANRCEPEKCARIP